MSKLFTPDDVAKIQVEIQVETKNRFSRMLEHFLKDLDDAIRTDVKTALKNKKREIIICCFRTSSYEDRLSGPTFQYRNENRDLMLQEIYEPLKRHLENNYPGFVFTFEELKDVASFTMKF
jgi:hypothetical protein